MADLSKKEEELLQKLLAKKLDEKGKKPVKLLPVERARIEKRLTEDGRAVLTLSSSGQVTCFSWETYAYRIATGLALSKEYPKAALKRGQREEDVLVSSVREMQAQHAASKEA